MHSRKYVLAASALIAIGGLTACTANSNGDDAASPGTIDIASLCEGIGAATTTLDVMNDFADKTMGLPETVEQTNRTACDNYRTGVELTQLRNLPVTWDQQCLEGNGWTLSENQAPIQLNGTTDHYYPAEVAHCASPVMTPQVCESVRQAMAPDQAALSPENASVVTKFGCTNIEVRKPS